MIAPAGAGGRRPTARRTGSPTRARPRVGAHQVAPGERGREQVARAGGVEHRRRVGAVDPQLPPVDERDRPSAPSVTAAMSATAASLAAARRSSRPRQETGLAAVDDQRPRPPSGRHLRQPPGERARVVVAAGEERAHAVGHDVDLLERGRDGARASGSRSAARARMPGSTVTIERSPATGITIVVGVRLPRGSPRITPSASSSRRTNRPARSSPSGATRAVLRPSRGRRPP